MDAVFEFPDEFQQKMIVSAERFRRFDRGGGVFAGGGAGAFDAVEGDIGALVAGGIVARRFAEGSGVRGCVEQVVHDLKSHAEMPADGPGAGERFFAGIGEAETHQERGGEEGGGFVFVNVAQRIGVPGNAFVPDILHLPADEFFAPGGLREIGDEGRGQRGLGGVVVGDKEKGVGEEGVARQNRGGLVELFVAGGPAPAQVTVVNRGQIVVDQGIGVETFDRDGGGEGIRPGRVKLRGLEEEKGADPFAAGAQRVAHCLVQPRWAGRGRRQKPFDAVFNPSLPGFQFLFQLLVHRG